MFVVTNWPSGHSVASSTRTLAPALTYSRDPGLGHPRAVDAAGGVGGEALGVGLRLDRDVAAALGGRRQALLLEPVAQCDVLGVAELRRGDGLALEAGRVGDLGPHDERGAARGGAGDDAHGRALGLRVGVDRGVRADVGDVERAARTAR